MRPAKMIKLGDEFLKNVSKDELRLMQAREKDYKVKAMLQAAIHRKKGMLLKEIAEAVGRLQAPYTAGCRGSKVAWGGDTISRVPAGHAACLRRR